MRANFYTRVQQEDDGWHADPLYRSDQMGLAENLPQGDYVSLDGKLYLVERKIWFPRRKEVGFLLKEVEKPKEDRA